MLKFCTFELTNFLQSYGGFVTSHTLGYADNPFKCGIAVAPVSNFKYYGLLNFISIFFCRNEVLQLNFNFESKSVKFIFNFFIVAKQLYFLFNQKVFLFIIIKLFFFVFSSDAMYTERYMTLPKNNTNGYNVGFVCKYLLTAYNKKYMSVFT